MLEPAQLIKLFATAKDVIVVQAGGLIFEAGSIGTTAFGVIEGEVDLIVNGKTVETIRQGDLLGEGALVQPSHQRFSTAVAKTDVRLAVVDREHFLFMVQETPLFALEVIRSLSSRLRALKGQI